MNEEQAANIADSIDHRILSVSVREAIVNGGPDQVIIHTYMGITDPYEDQWSVVRQEIEIFDGKASSVRYHYKEGQWKLLEKPLEFIGEIDIIQRDVYECM